MKDLLTTGRLDAFYNVTEHSRTMKPHRII